MNNSAFYITTNEVPEFGDDDEYVKRRIAVFKTKSLPQYTSGADCWMFDHAMDCISWLANKIKEHRDHEDLWYDTGKPANQCIIENESGLRFFRCRRCAEGYDGRFKSKCNNRSEMVQSTNAIHNSFNLEVKRQRLATKRKAIKSVVLSHAQYLSQTKWNSRLNWNNRSAH